MKITFSNASPYVRKAMACAVARGIDNKIERWTIPATDPAITEFNPLNKVPTLVTDDVGPLWAPLRHCFPHQVRLAGMPCVSRRWVTA
jgi:glutathione S-transferase